MPMEMEMPESFDTGGAFLKEPGTYHLAVLEVDEQPTSQKGELIDGFKIDAHVLAGPQNKKQAEITFWNPKLTDKNNGEMAKKKQARFVLATGIIQAAKPGEKVVVDLQLAKGRQFIATLSNRESNGKTYIDLNFADIWHVDDPAAPQCERNQEALKLLPASLRRKPESFKPANAGGNSNGNGNGHAKPASGQSQQSAAPVSTGVDLDDV